MKRLLVTGRHGFVGSTLARLVDSDPSLRAWQLATISEQFEILDVDAVRRLVDDAAPDAVVHLAARSSVAESLRDPEGTLRVNLFGTLNLLRALDDARFSGPLLFVSSGDVYGNVPEHRLPVDENQPPSPRNPYAVSKVAAEALCRQWALTSNKRVVVARPFNHIGPGQGEQFAIPAFVRQIAEIRAGLCPPVVAVGDIDVTRDFTDVRDIVRAYVLAATTAEPGEVYNIASGHGHSIRDLLDTLITLSGLEVEVKIDTQRLRPSDVEILIGDSTKFRERTGWEPAIPLQTTLSDLLDYWRRRLRASR